jgi:hypothetical protein
LWPDVHRLIGWLDTIDDLQDPLVKREGPTRKTAPAQFLIETVIF